jgi:hypothetical protein
MNPEQGLKVVAKVKESIAEISDPLVKNMVFVKTNGALCI